MVRLFTPQKKQPEFYDERFCYHNKIHFQSLRELLTRDATRNEDIDRKVKAEAMSKGERAGVYKVLQNM